MRLAIIATILGGVAAIVSVALGGHIYRREMIIWPSAVIVWAVIAAVFWRLSEMSER